MECVEEGIVKSDVGKDDVAIFVFSKRKKLGFYVRKPVSRYSEFWHVGDSRMCGERSGMMPRWIKSRVRCMTR